MSNGKVVTELSKNAREVYRFRLATFKDHQFVDMRIFSKEEDKDPTPTKKGISVSPKLWPQFRHALTQLEEAMIAEGWLDRED